MTAFLTGLKYTGGGSQQKGDVLPAEQKNVYYMGQTTNTSDL